MIEPVEDETAGPESGSTTRLSAVELLAERERELRNQLCANLDARLGALSELLDETNKKWVYDDLVYRFYHQSFKVFALQEVTVSITDALAELNPVPGGALNEFYTTIIESGTGKVFVISDNDHWLESTRPIVEAFFHAHYMLSMAVKFGELARTGTKGTFPSGWAAFLYLYNLR
jgi:hypothetical protein